MWPLRLFIDGKVLHGLHYCVRQIIVLWIGRKEDGGLSNFATRQSNSHFFVLFAFCFFLCFTRLKTFAGFLH